jgi:UDP-N-acetylmuramoyl-L-alanyl-D-glutamate--2,6-diaminopimelate ligase
VSIEAPSAVRLHSIRLHDEGTRAVLAVRRSLPALGGGTVQPPDVPVTVRMRGPSALRNVALAAAAALCAGAGGDAIAAALDAFTPPRRRTEILYRGAFTVLDDTVGHPESVSALFSVVRSMRPRRLHIAIAIRGRRGPAINRHLAQALAVYAARLPVASLIVTSSAEATDERNRVRPDERAAFLDSLDGAGIAFEETEHLDAAVLGVLERARPGDLVLLLGAQGMDPGSGIARSWLRERGAGN